MPVKFFGILFVIGLLIQILTSVTWQSYGSYGESIFMLGQSIGELCYIFACRKLFEKYGFFVAVSEFAISLILVDMVTIIFLNPYEISVSKYAGFAIAFFVLMVRIKNYLKPNT